MCYLWPVPTQDFNTRLLLNSLQPPYIISPWVHLHSLPWIHYSQQWQYQGPPLPPWFLSLTLIFCPSRGRGLTVSCLSARQFYLSITKPSAVLQWPQPCINPLSASQPSITLLSITSDPSSAHLSHTAHARRWSPRRAPLASDRGWTGQLGIRKLKGNAKRRLYPTLPSLCLHPSESILFVSLHAY